MTSQNQAPPRIGPVLATTTLAVVIVVAGVSSLNVAIPVIGRELQASQSDLQWIIDAYAVTLAALLLPFGALGDRFGRKRLMVIGLLVMLGGTVLAAVASSTEGLIAARALSGIGAAMVFPGTLSTLTNVVPDERRGQAVGIWAAGASLGGVLGVVSGGGLIDAFDDYAAVFWGTAVVILVCAALMAVVVPETTDAAHAHLDPLGSLLSFVAVGGIVLGVIEGPVKGWTDGLTLSALIIGALASVAFVAWQLRTPRPLLDVRLFRNRGFSTGSVSVFLQFFGAFGFFFVGAQYLSLVLGYEPFVTGLALLPIGALLPVLSQRAPDVARRFGRGPVGGIGLALVAAACVAMTTIELSTSYWVFAGLLVVFGAGMGLAAAPATEAIVESLPREQQGVASAVNDVSRELGGALGIAVVGSAFNSAYRASIDDASGVLSAAPPEVVEVIRESPAAGLGVASQLGPLAEGIVPAVRASFLDGFGTSLWVAAAALVLGAAYVALRSPRVARPVPEAAEVTSPAAPSPR